MRLQLLGAASLTAKQSAALWSLLGLLSFLDSSVPVGVRQRE